MERSSFFPLIHVGVLALGAVFVVIKIVALMGRIRDLSLGRDAEVAVGQELNQLARDGFDVFHDVYGDGPFNVDHVVVGRSGVYAIETKGRSKPLRNGKAEFKVRIEGDRLVFPHKDGNIAAATSEGRRQMAREMVDVCNR